MAKALRVISRDSKESIIAAGNSAAWHGKESTMRTYRYLLVVTPKDRTPVLVARVKEIEPVPESGPNRWALSFDRYAEVSDDLITLAGDKSSNPAISIELNDEALARLDWKDTPPRRPDAPKWSFSSAPIGVNSGPLSIAEAKRRLAVSLGVRPENIEITIKA